MAGVYRPRHPERTALYRVLFHFFDRFLAEYESRFEKQYGFLRPIIKEIIERFLDCGNPRCGFARIRCLGCHTEHLLMFSCRTRGFCPPCHAKRLEEWGEWMRETLLLDVPHRQVVFTIPKMLRIFFSHNRRLLGSLCRSALRSLARYFEVVTGSELMPGVIAAIQAFCELNLTCAKGAISSLRRRAEGRIVTKRLARPATKKLNSYSLRYRSTVYAGCFIALADIRKSPLVTANKKLIKKAGKRTAVVRLSDALKG